MNMSEGQAKPLGCEHDGQGANFSVFSSVADKVEICFFDSGGEERGFELAGGGDGYWHGRFEPVEAGTRYGFRVHGPWDPPAGHLCCPEKLLIDPYAKALDGFPRWSDALFPYRPDAPEEPADLTDTASDVPKSVVVRSDFDWGGDGPPGNALEDTVIYEVHVKGFTARHPKIPPEIRGTYAGMAHPAAVEHLTRLGVTAVELLPVQQFVHRRRLIDMDLRNYWGYDPICFFAPHNEYASDRAPGGAVDEFKAMVKALHSAGIEVILDVVFNHTAEGGTDGALLSFKGLDNRAYYRLCSGDGLHYADLTGTQNTVNARHPRVLEMIIDSLRYWVEQMHVDGFRFDLATVLARTDEGVDFHAPFFEKVRNDPSLSKVKLIAEPWDLGGDGYQAGRFPKGWSEWNDKYRDQVRDYWNGRGSSAGRFMLRIAGSPDLYRESGRSPQASINAVTTHDGFTLSDLVSYERKRNQANGEEGRDGPDDNHSWNCGIEGPSDEPAVVELRARQKRNFMATLLLSRGVPMLLGGDELGRTQAGNNNAYCQDNEISWFDWEGADDALVEFVRKLVSLRKHLPALRAGGWPGAQRNGPGRRSLTWHDSTGGGMSADAAPDSPREPLQAVLWAPEEDRGRAGSSPCADLLVLLNPRSEETLFNLPPGCGSRDWKVIVDTNSGSVSVEGTGLVRDHVTLVSSSMTALRRA